MILLIDNYDSFTYNLTDYFLQLGEDITVIKNDEADSETIKAYNFSRLVISPGPNTPSESGNLMQLIDACYRHFPVLGICLGHQALGTFFGATLKRAERPVHGKVSPIYHNGSGLYKNLPQGFNVCRYHSLILDNLSPDTFEISARTSGFECMGLKHKEFPIYGMQYHPEAILTEFGLKQLESWLKITDPGGF